MTGLATQARTDHRRHKHEAIGRVLYAVVFAAIITFAVGEILTYYGWL